MCEISTISSNKKEIKNFFENTKNIAIARLSPKNIKVVQNLYAMIEHKAIF